MGAFLSEKLVGESAKKIQRLVGRKMFLLEQARVFGRPPERLYKRLLGRCQASNV